MWIFMVKDLPVGADKAPPKMSIHYSWPWTDPKYAQEQKHRLEHPDQWGAEAQYSESSKFFVTPFGFEHDWRGARKILYKGNQIRVFPDEFNEVTPEKLKYYMSEDAYEFVSDPMLKEEFPSIVMTRNRKAIFDAALVDGCDKYEAMMVCLGHDPSEIPPPLGWFKLREEYAAYFGVSYENVDTEVEDDQESEDEDEYGTN